MIVVFFGGEGTMGWYHRYHVVVVEWYSVRGGMLG